jgi:hypothetical protein
MADQTLNGRKDTKLQVPKHEAFSAIAQYSKLESKLATLSGVIYIMHKDVMDLIKLWPLPSESFAVDQKELCKISSVLATPPNL